jgi:hypothetical protein
MNMLIEYVYNDYQSTCLINCVCHSYNNQLNKAHNIGIIIHREYDKHRKSDTIIVTSNNYPTAPLENDATNDRGDTSQK